MSNEINVHAKRIITGAAVLSAGLVAVRGYAWLAYHHTTIALAPPILAAIAIACYMLGVVGLEIIPEINELDRP